jgi:hypothetical protein
LEVLKVAMFPLFSETYTVEMAEQEDLKSNLDSKNPIFNLLNPIIEATEYKLNMNFNRQMSNISKIVIE